MGEGFLGWRMLPPPAAVLSDSVGVENGDLKK